MKAAKSILLFLVLLILGRSWIGVDQFFLPNGLLFPAFIVVMCLLMVGYFLMVKPVNVRRFSLVLSGCVAAAVAILSIVQHVIVQHDFAVMWPHSLRLLVISFCLPLVIGAGYAIMAKRKNR